MKRNIWLILAGLILTMLIATPAMGQEKEKSDDHWGHFASMRREMLAKELKLSPEKTKEFQAVSEKYQKSRKETFQALKKAKEELKGVMATGKPDEAKVKALVGAITAEQDKLLNSFKVQRDEEMASLTPEQQANYLLIQAKWRKEMMKEHWKEMKEHGKEMLKKKMEKKEEKK